METPTQAGFVEDTGAADRIEAADKLRTLTQTLASAACHAANGVDVEANRGVLTNGAAKFDALLNALRHGDEQFHIIGAEKRGSTIRMLDTMDAEWAPVHAALDTLAADLTDAAALSVIYANNATFYEATKVLLAQLEGEYSNPVELLQSDVILIDIAGQQATAAQRLAFEACLVWSGVATQKEKDELLQLTQQFAFAVNALHDGAPEFGVMVAPTEEITLALEEVVEDWDSIAWKLENLAASESITPDEASFLCKILFKKMVAMEDITHMYVEYSRRVY
ncbi:MAG: type IV pili methyl-accepting chemotaxis transducer N-terminal domain-containing protein [Pseudomonadota bacterium]